MLFLGLSSQLTRAPSGLANPILVLMNIERRVDFIVERITADRLQDAMMTQPTKYVKQMKEFEKLKIKHLNYFI